MIYIQYKNKEQTRKQRLFNYCTTSGPFPIKQPLYIKCLYQMFFSPQQVAEGKGCYLSNRGSSIFETQSTPPGALALIFFLNNTDMFCSYQIYCLACIVYLHMLFSPFRRTFFCFSTLQIPTYPDLDQILLSL